MTIHASRPTSMPPTDRVARGSSYPISSGLIDGLRAAAAAGHDGHMVAHNDGTVQCRSCGSTTPADRLPLSRCDRLEDSTDDASEMLLVVWTWCSTCGRRATLTLGYGPNAGEADLAVLGSLGSAQMDHDVRPLA